MKTVVIVLSLLVCAFCVDYKPVLEPFDSSWTTRWTIPEGAEKDWEYGSLRGFEFTLDAVTPNKRFTANQHFPGYYFEPKQGGVVLQFEVQLQDFDWSPTQTGFLGTKLYRAGSGYDITKGNDGPHTIAFGLDLATKKLRFEVGQWNPLHGEYRYHVYQPSPEFPTDSKVHYYTLFVKLNSTFTLHIDGTQVHEGNFVKGWNPALVPPHGIPDPKEVPPAGWTGDLENLDAEPDLIPDPSVKKPEGWDVDAPEFIPSPYVIKPVDWDEELDGPWEAPLIQNPVCVAFGCGPWEAPLIVNPRKWRPTLRPNPEYFQNPNPHYFTSISGVGLESDFTGYGRVKFDNVYLGFNHTLAEEFAERTFTLKKLVQDKDSRTKVARKISATGQDSNPYANQKALWDEIISGEAYLLYATVALVIPFLICVLVPRKPAEIPRPASDKSETKKPAKKDDVPKKPAQKEPEPKKTPKTETTTKKPAQTQPKEQKKENPPAKKKPETKKNK